MEKQLLFVRRKKVVQMPIYGSQWSKGVILALFVTLFAFQETYGAIQSITLKEKNISLENLFEKIKEKSEYRFFWKGAEIGSLKTSVHLKNASIDETMSAAVKGLPIDYKITDKSIVISQKAGAPVAQENIRFEGTLKNKEGKPIAAGTVRIVSENYQKLLSSDDKGVFKFNNIPPGVYKVYVTCVGYNGKEVSMRLDLGQNINRDFVLDFSDQSIEPVVATGYGTVKRKNLTGSIGSIDRSAIENTSITSVDQLLQGKIAGVDVMVSSGMPGAAVKVRIRGNSSLIGNTDPLYVVDGIPVITDRNYAFNQTTGGDIRENLSGLLNINLADVESIDVLKDASAAAIYGSRAANGVVIITTRKGVAGQKPLINVGYDYGFQNMHNEYRPLNSNEFRNIMTEAANNGSKSLQGWWSMVYPHLSLILDSPDEYFGKEDINWLKMMTNDKSSTQNFNISSRGGSENITYYLSYSNNQNKGVLLGSGMNRNSGKAQLDAYINPSLRVGANINIASTDTDIKNGGLTNLITWRPDLPIYNADGSYFSYNSTDNPLAASTQINNAIETGLNGSGYLELKIIPGLMFKSALSFSYDLSKTRLYFPTTTIQGSYEGGIGEQSHSENFNQIFDNTLTYSKLFSEKHDLSALIGASYERLTSQFFTGIGTGFPNDHILNNLSSAAKAYAVSGDKEKVGLASYFSRVNYIYDDRYLLTFTGRLDGSSKFGSDNRYGFFPSVAGAWKINNESFLADIDWLDQLKLRASYGLVGGSSLGTYRWRTKYTAGGYAGLPGIIPQNLENPNLKWERTKMFDSGLEFSLFDYRLNGAFGVYSKYTNDLLQTTTIASSTGFANVTRNVSEVSNRGVEMELSTYAFKKENFRWYISANASRNIGVIEKLNDGLTVGSYYDDNRFIEGEPFGTLWGYVANGIIQSQEEIDLLNKQAREKTGNPNAFYQEEFTAPGDIRFADINGDGKVDFEDQQVIGNSSPKWTGGLTNTFNFLDNFTLNIYSSFSIGGKKLWNAKRTSYAFYDQNQSHLMLDRWTEENPTNDAPRLSIGDRVNNARVSTFWLHDYSYFKIQDIHLSYKLPSSIASKVKTRNLMLHMSVSNIATFTKYPGMSPEGFDATYDGAFYNGSIDYADYPMTKTWSFGIKAEL